MKTNPSTKAETLAILNEEFPALSPKWTHELAERFEHSVPETTSILELLRSINRPVDDRVAEFVLQETDEANADWQDSEPEPDEPSYEFSYYLSDEGFTPLRHRVTALACETLDQHTTQELWQAMRNLNPWLQCAEGMELKYNLNSWQESLAAALAWQHHIIERQDPIKAAKIAGHEDGRFTAWNSLIPASKTRHHIIAAILNEQDLLSESAKTDHDFYRRYLKNCRSNGSRPFAIISDQIGDTVGLCLLRYRKHRWYLALPTNISIYRIDYQHHDELLEELKAFAAAYDRAARRHTDGRRHQSWSYLPGRDDPSKRPKTETTPAKTKPEPTTPEPMPCPRCLSTRNIPNPDPTNKKLTPQICTSCKTKAKQEQVARRTTFTYLYDVLEARTQGAPEPPLPEALYSVVKPDSTTPRTDAVAGKLSPGRSRELCREYVQESRNIPELALRFAVSINTVINTLRGNAWAKHTNGQRPNQLTDEPKRSIIKTKPYEQPKLAYITPSRLKGEYGWTDRLIQKHLGEADHEAPNPHYRTASPMRLYLLDRAHEVMATNAELREQLNIYAERRAKKQKTTQAQILKQRQDLLDKTDRMDPVTISLPSNHTKSLIDMAVTHRLRYLEQTMIYTDYEIPTNNDSPAAEELAVSMIRHEFTNYEQLLQDMPRSRNPETNALIYLRVKTKVLDAIAKALPELTNACNRTKQNTANRFYLDSPV